MDDLKKLLFDKANSIDNITHRSEIELANKEIQRIYGKSVKLAKVYDDGNGLLVCSNSATASDVRFAQDEVKSIINSAAPKLVKEVRIVISDK